jgi:hypothetical protein
LHFDTQRAGCTGDKRSTEEVQQRIKWWQSQLKLGTTAGRKSEDSLQRMMCTQKNMQVVARLSSRRQKKYSCSAADEQQQMN